MKPKMDKNVDSFIYNVNKLFKTYKNNLGRKLLY